MKTQNDIQIRSATPQDAKALLEIYTPYVKNTAITFEYEVPSVEEFEQRMLSVQKKFPYLVAQADGQILGYAYVCPFKERAAYDWAVETSIYVKVEQKRNKIGSRLYAALEQILKEQGILNLNACIACPETEDEYLTKNSVIFHQKLGFQLVGEFHQCGYKFNRWYHMIWMEKHIGSHMINQPAVKTFAEVRSCINQKYGTSY